MKIDVDATLNPQAAGPGRATAAIVQPNDPKTLPGVALLFLGEGRTVRVMLSCAEAQMVGAMLVTCGCVAEGGPPPVAQVAPVKSPIIINGGRA